MVLPKENFPSEETKKQCKKDVKMSNSSTASQAFHKTQFPGATSTNVSMDKSNNNNVISSSKAATPVPPLVRKKSRIFEDLPKLFESNVPEDLTKKNNLGRRTSDIQTTPLQFQEGSFYFVFFLVSLRKLGTPSPLSPNF